MSITINPPAGPWTVDDLGDIEDMGFRFEIHEGNLVLVSPATRWHVKISRRITNALDETDGVIFQYKLATTADGQAGYAESGMTTVSALEQRLYPRPV